MNEKLQECLKKIEKTNSALLFLNLIPTFCPNFPKEGYTWKDDDIFIMLFVRYSM